MKLKSTLAIIISCIVVITAVELFYKNQRIYVKPHLYGERLQTYSDTSGDNGLSTINLDSVSKKGCYFSYILNNSYHYYYAGVHFFQDLNSPLNLKEYHTATIKIEAPQSNTMRFFMLTHEPSTFDSTDAQSWLHLRETIPLEKGLNTYRFKLSGLYTPQWWYKLYSKEKSDVTKEPLSKVLAIKVESGEGEPLGIKTSVHIEEIYFSKKIPTWIRLLEATVLLIAITVLILFLRKRLSRAKIGGYEKISLGNQYDEDVEGITDYIGRCYATPDLKIDTVADACSMHPDKVASTIKSEYNQSFKQYLNSIRLTEAKRLLLQTDRQISEIAHTVGYSNVSHFNRVFKGELNCTPREFRLKKGE